MNRINNSFMDGWVFISASKIIWLSGLDSVCPILTAYDRQRRFLSLKTIAILHPEPTRPQEPSRRTSETFGWNSPTQTVICWRIGHTKTMRQGDWLANEVLSQLFRPRRTDMNHGNTTKTFTSGAMRSKECSEGSNASEEYLHDKKNRYNVHRFHYFSNYRR